MEGTTVIVAIKDVARRDCGAELSRDMQCPELVHSIVSKTGCSGNRWALSTPRALAPPLRGNTRNRTVRTGGFCQRFPQQTAKQCGSNSGVPIAMGGRAIRAPRIRRSRTKREPNRERDVQAGDSDRAAFCARIKSHRTSDSRRVQFATAAQRNCAVYDGRVDSLAGTRCSCGWRNDALRPDAPAARRLSSPVLGDAMREHGRWPRTAKPVRTHYPFHTEPRPAKTTNARRAEQPASVKKPKKLTRISSTWRAL
jgi:hypothetical protein